MGVGVRKVGELIKTISRGILFKAEGEDINWAESPYEEYLPGSTLKFSSDIRALFSLADELYVATENGGIYRIDGIGLSNFNVCVVRCSIVEAN